MPYIKRFILILWISIFMSGCVSPANPLDARSTTEPTPTYPAEKAQVAATPTPLPSLQPTIASTPAGAWIHLNPNYGNPGTTVQINGYLPGGLSEDELKTKNFLTHADICWGGCQNGLMELGLDVTWSAQDPGQFSLQMIVPSIPWLAFDGLHPLEPGDYPISILYLDLSAAGCKPSVASGKDCPVTPQVSAAFHLTAGYSGSECRGESCGWLKATPSQAAPGETVQVEGWAPLLEIIGQPFGYYLVLETKPGATSYSDLINVATVQQDMDGSLRASFQVPQYNYENTLLTPSSYTFALLAGGLTTGKGSPPFLIAAFPFEIAAAPSWTGRQRSAPLWIQPSAALMNQSLSLDPVHPERLAFCAQNAIRVSQDGGQNWNSISTHGVSGQEVAPDIAVNDLQPLCTSVTLDSTHPNSFYAVFSAGNKQQRGWPIYFVGFFTTDRGKTWQIVPVASVQTSGGSADGRFGGFRTDGKIVQALYFGDPNAPGQKPPVLAKQTGDGGTSWTPAQLTCPPDGPCLRWGPAAGGIYGMGSDIPQVVMASFDGGQSWGFTGESVELRSNNPHELAAFSPDETLVISGGARYPLRYSPDGGKTWQTLGLPSLPEASSGWPSGYAGLQMLPDGSLLAMNPDTGQWWGLSLHANQWCALQFTSPDKFPLAFQWIGKQVWWLSPSSAQPQSALMSQFACRP